MNGCQKIELELAAYCSGELDPAGMDMVRRHLAGCALCREELGRELEIRGILGTLPEHEFPEDLEHRIKAAALRPVASIPPARHRRRMTAVLVLAAASLAVALLVPALDPVSGPDQSWTEEEIAAARQEVMFTLALTAKVIDRTQKNTMVDVFADKLPHAIDESFKMVKPKTPGGNG